MMIGFGAAAAEIAARPHSAPATAAPIIRQAMTPHKVVALTFDDGPSPRWTPKVLAVLNKDHVHATFFIIGSHALRHPALVREEQRAGMDVESHGHQHLILRHRTAAEVRQEVEYNAHILKSLGVPHPTLYRLPGGQQILSHCRRWGKWVIASLAGASIPAIGNTGIARPKWFIGSQPRFIPVP
ncbi:polysaccharide deacetylase family protein [Sulfobacillus thermosulfidooxidans]|uniref:polysaccharide deacetylase family protein n=1 Tax=Sulfobacillus thermosulfidooxidans TaxID=28034 RepID=UPI0006B43410|nr:polysaccharide deacetylase family protein [Sulfobacillus thermosulfidooxidans]